ncbi:MAG: type II secretion system protein N [Gammaproteobacteria bacterium]|nr:type II secretion system protein N [Gammaproteobacteria bacterium]
MRKRYLIMFAILAYAAALVATLPTAQLLRWVDSRPAQLSGVGGSVWRGSARRVKLEDAVADDVHWRFLPARLLWGEVAFGVQAQYAGGPADGRVSADLHRELHLRDFSYRMDARRLADFMPLPIAEFSGDIRTDLERVTVRDGVLHSVTGKVTWDRATLTSPFETMLGNYRVDVRTTERGHRAQLRGEGGSLAAEGEVRVQQDGRFNAAITLTPARNAPSELVQQLNFIARKQRNGKYLLKHSGSLRDFW